MNNLQNELRSLVAKVNSLSVKSAPSAKALRRRRQRQRKKLSSVVAPVVQQPIMNTVGGSRRRRRRGGASAIQGQCTISRREFLIEVKGGDMGVLKLTPSSFQWLASLSKSFDRVIWNRMAFFWKAAVGTTTNGLMSYGVDWNSSTTSVTDRKKVLMLTPVTDVPVWQSTESSMMVLPASKLMSRKEYLIGQGDIVDQVPGYLCYACSNGDKTLVCGELWVEYTAVLFGTTS